MNKKNTIRLTESDLKKVISESVKKVLKEGYDDNPPTGYETFFNLGEQYANTVFKELSSKYRNVVDVKVIKEIIKGFELGLWAFAQVGDDYENIRGFGIRRPREY